MIKYVCKCRKLNFSVSFFCLKYICRQEQPTMPQGENFSAQGFTGPKNVSAVDFSGVMYYNYSIFEENFYCKNIKENCHENK